jgi:hypothetical protein
MDEKEIKTKAEFIIFLNALARNHKRSPDEWENKKLDNYLTAMAGWVGERESYYETNNLMEPADINWGYIANMFLAAKIYE